MRIDEAKAALPLPTLLYQLGLGEHAKKSARCPFHDDQHNSFSIWKNGDDCWAWKCHASCGAGDQINFLELHEKLSRRDAIKRYLEMAGVNAATPRSALTPAFDWQQCSEAFTEEYVEHIANWRKFSPQFVRELRDNGQIGIYNGLVAFPVINSNKIVGTHFRLKSGKWNYEPQGINALPLIFGELVPGERVQGFESTWDGLDYMDKSGERSGVVITRGAGNTKFVTALIPRNCTLYLWTQNDKPGEDWQRKICESAKCLVKRVKIPAPHKDLNDWTRAGASSDDLLATMMNAELVAAPTQPPPLASLLDAVCAFLTRFIVFSYEAQPFAIALWVAHAWALEAFDYTPYLHIASAEKQCGKTRLLDCLELLTPKPWRAILPSEAVLFRTIERDRPTLLLDELDGVFSNSKDERKEALRSLLNAGFEEKARIPRCVGQGTNQEVKNFAVFCAKALAGIGKLPDTIRDRSVPIQLVPARA
jgi:hypothetical protein